MTDINNSLALGIQNNSPDIGKTLLTAAKLKGAYNTNSVAAYPDGAQSWLQAIHSAGAPSNGSSDD